MNSMQVECPNCRRRFYWRTEHAHYVGATGLCFSCKKVLTEDDVKNVLIHIAKETQRTHRRF